MPQAIVAAAVAIASSIGEVVTAVTTSAAIGAAVANGVLALTGAAGIGAFVSSWAVVGSVASAFSGPKKIGGVSDGGTQVDFKANPTAGVPLVLGRTGTGGQIAHMTTDGQANKNAHLLTCVILSLGPIQGLDGFTANNVAVTFDGLGQASAPAQYVGAMDMRVQNGDDPSGAFPPPSVPAGTIVEWDDTHKLSGLGAVWWSLNYSQTAFPTGVPQPLWTVKGPAVYDPRLDSTYAGGAGPQRWNDQTTWGVAGYENPYLQALTWCIGRKSALGTAQETRVVGLGVDLAQIDVDSFVEGANVAEANAWKVGGVVTSSDAKWDVLVAILQAGGGVPMRLGGKISCVVNTPRVSLRTFTGADVVGEAVVTGTKSRRERFNAVAPRYRSEANGWQIVNAGDVVVDAYVTDDGDRRTHEIEYSLVQSAAQVAQLAAYDVVNAREAEPIVLPMKPLYAGYKGGDCLTVNEPDLGLNNQKVLVVTRQVDPMTLTATLTVRTETDAKHPFALGQTGSPPPTPSLTGVDVSFVNAPGAGDFSAVGTALTGASGSMPALVVSGIDDNPNAADVVVRYKIHTDTAWNLWAPVHAKLGDAVRIEITGVADGSAYDVEVAYRSVRGLLSAWVDLGTVTAGALGAGGVGDTVPPADVAGSPTVTLQQGFDDAGSTFAFLRATWTANTDADLDGYIVHIDDGFAAVDVFAESNACELRGLEPGKTYTVKVKAVDKSGNVSVGYSGSGSVTVGSIHEGSNLLYDGGFALKAQNWTLVNWSVIADTIYGPILTTALAGTQVSHGPDVAIKAAQAYTLSAIAVTSGATAGSCYFDVQWLDAGKALISTSAPLQFLDISTDGFVTSSLTSPALAAFARIRVYSSGVTFATGGFAFCYHVKFEGGSKFTGWNDDSTAGALYADGTSIDSLKPADASSTKNNVFRSSSTPVATGLGDFWIVLDGLGNAVALRQWNGTAWVMPADLTSGATAAGIAGQGPLATSTLTPTQVTNTLIPTAAPNRLRLTDFEKGVFPWVNGTNPSGLSRSSTTGASGGVPFLQFSATATAAAQEVSMFTSGDEFAVTPGEQLAVSMVTGATNGQIKFAVQFRNSSGTVFSTSTGFFFVSGAAFPALGQEMIVVPAGAVTAYLEVYIDSAAAGSMVAKVGQPYVMGVPVGQTTFPAYARGASNTAGADVTLVNTAAAISGQGSFATLSSASLASSLITGKTADNISYTAGGTVDALKPAEAGANVTSTHTAAAITGQGALATLGAAAWSTQVTGTGKPADNADVTSTHTAAAITGQTGWATLSYSTNRLQYVNNTGRMGDQRFFVPNLGIDGVGSRTTQPLSSTDTTISLSSFTITLPQDMGGGDSFGEISVSIPSSSSSGLNPDTTYTVFYLGGSYTFAGPSAAPVFRASPDGWIETGYVRTAVSGSSTYNPPPYGSGGVAVDGYCVARSAFVGPDLLAGDVGVGSPLVMMAPAGDRAFPGAVERVTFADAPCLRLRTAKGGVLTVSDTAPLMTRTAPGRLPYAIAARDARAGLAVPLYVDGGVVWDLIESIESLGRLPVALISAGDGIYAASDDPSAPPIFTHNSYNKP